ncbi:hypothetical protein MMPV_007812 [Pyropia vietnamensis]
MMFPALHAFPVGLRVSQRKLRALPSVVAIAVAALALLLLLGVSTRGVPGRRGGRHGGDGSAGGAATGAAAAAAAAGRLARTPTGRQPRVIRPNGSRGARPPLTCRGLIKFPRSTEEGWFFCDAPSLAGGTVVTVGVGRNVVWDAAMVGAYGTTHYGFDPTPRSVSFYVANPERLPPGFSFHPLGLGVRDELVEMELPAGNIDSYVPAALLAPAGRRRVRVPVFALSTLLRVVGVEWVDLLKVDVEGAEGDVVQSWVDSGYSPPADQVLMETHARFNGDDPAFVPRLIENMQTLGFRLFYRVHFELSFVRTEAVDVDTPSGRWEHDADGTDKAGRGASSAAAVAAGRAAAAARTGPHASVGTPTVNAKGERAVQVEGVVPPSDATTVVEAA